ncbi:hypothetical protein NDU88_005352 [Pleurodeles waltl]|uniref:Uncharacterized protein n=1 Tax=Pleurodeles waltl TaxID=8319 RepID=A0AAV7UIC1_PLEWA|nr:hypothetical protein NDU88_005352 [Pleurodeles waltl]
MRANTNVDTFALARHSACVQTAASEEQRVRADTSVDTLALAHTLNKKSKPVREESEHHQKKREGNFKYHNACLFGVR